MNAVHLATVLFQVLYDYAAISADNPRIFGQMGFFDPHVLGLALPFFAKALRCLVDYLHTWDSFRRLGGLYIASDQTTEAFFLPTTRAWS